MGKMKDNSIVILSNKLDPILLPSFCHTLYYSLCTVWDGREETPYHTTGTLFPASFTDKTNSLDLHSTLHYRVAPL